MEWMTEFESISSQIESIRSKAKELVNNAVVSINWWIEDK